MANIILASGSPRRKLLLERLNLPFKVVKSDIKEEVDPALPGDAIVRQLAVLKAGEVAGQHPDSLTIGADTIVVMDNEILEKPNDRQHAFEMLNKLSNKTHRVYTGVSLVKSDESGNIKDQTAFSECTEVTFGPLEEKDILSYIKTGSPMDKAGSYGIQDRWGALFVRKINGDYYNVVGFPLYRFYQTLKQFAPDVLADN